MKAVIAAVLLVGCLSAISNARRPVAIKTESDMTCIQAGGLCIDKSFCLPGNKSNDTSAICTKETDVCCHQGGDLSKCSSHGGECMSRDSPICKSQFARKAGTECEQKDPSQTCCVAF